MKKKILSCVLYLALFLSLAINVYYLVPPKVSESISRGYYVSRDTDGNSYGLSIMDDNKVILYDPSTHILLKGKLELNKENNDYLITTASNTFEVVARDNVVFLPIIENGRIISKLFTKIDNASVTYGRDGSATYEE